MDKSGQFNQITHYCSDGFNQGYVGNTWLNMDEVEKYENIC